MKRLAATSRCRMCWISRRPRMAESSLLP